MLLVAVTRTRSSARTEQLDVTEARRVGRIVLHMSRHLKLVVVHVTVRYVNLSGCLAGCIPDSL